MGTADLQANGPFELEPDRVYQFHAVWELDAADDEVGEADYYVVTEHMTEAEISAAESVDGIYSTVITLSNGQELLVDEHDSPVSLTLLGVYDN